MIFVEQILHERFAAFDFSRILARTEYRNILRFERIDNSCRQRIIGTDNGKSYFMLFGKSSQLIELKHADRHTFRQLGNPGIAGCTVDFTGCGALGQLPDYRMLPASAADH
ncbi:hypothetical protein D3C81_1878880 [compost metagenome]